MVETAYKRGNRKIIQRLESTVDSFSTEIQTAGRSTGRLNLSQPDSIEMSFQHLPTGVCRLRGIFPTLKTSNRVGKIKNVMACIRQLFWLGIGRLAGIFTAILALSWVVGFNSKALAQAQEISSNQFDTLVLLIQSQSSSIETLYTIIIAGFASAFVIAGGMFWTLNKKIDGVENRVNTKIDNLKEDVNTKFGNLKEDLNTKFDNMKEDVNTKFGSLKEDVNTKFDSMKEDVNTKFGNLKEDLNTQFQGVKDLINENRKNNQEAHHRQELLLKEVLWYLRGGKSGSIPEMPGRETANEEKDKTTS